MRKIVLVIAVCVSFLACEKKKRNSVFEYYKDGAFKSITPYDSGHINGQVQWFYPNSKIEQIVNFKSGKENGNAYYFYKSGALKNFRNWKEGKMVGWANDFYDDSVWIMKSVLFFNNRGELIYKKNYDRSGQVTSEEGKHKPPH